ncbi:MAG: CVNH domain-containing protein [Pseudomonadota bacterium]
MYSSRVVLLISSLWFAQAGLAVTPELTSENSSTFQNYCSNIEFVLDDNKPTLQAVCLKDDGKFDTSTLTLDNIGNVNGVLTEADGASTFQQSCGNIQIQVDGPFVTLTAICFNSAGQPVSTSYDLNGISSDNGQLGQQ